MTLTSSPQSDFEPHGIPCLRPADTPIRTDPRLITLGVGLLLLLLSALGFWGGTELKFSPEQCEKSKFQGEICLVWAAILGFFGMVATVEGFNDMVNQSAKGT